MPSIQLTYQDKTKILLVTTEGASMRLSSGPSVVAGVSSFNGRAGVVLLLSADVTNALGYTPYNATNPNGYISGISGSDVISALGYTPYNGATNPNGYITTLSGSDVITALGYTPYNATNPNGYISGITSGMVTTALGFTPYNATNPANYITAAGAPVQSVFGRTGTVVLLSGDVTGALGFTPYNATNPSGYISSISGSDVTTALGYTPYNATNPSGYISGITSGMVTTALGFTPYNATNPSNYITSAGAPVQTVFGRSGAVVAASNDYTFSQLASIPTTVSGYGISDAVTTARTISTTSPITGGGDLSANRTIAWDFTVSNTWTAVQTIKKDNIGVANTDALVLTNTQAALVNAQQISPSLRQIGQGWKTTATAASEQVEYLQYVLPVQSTTHPIAEWHLDSIIAGGTQNKCLGFTTNGNQLQFYKTATAGTFNGIGTDTNGFLLLTGGAASAVNIAIVSGSTLRTASTRSAAGSFFQLLSSGATSTSGELILLDLHEQFSPASGTATYEALGITSVINQTGGASGISRGIYINPTLTAAADYRAIEIVAGKVVLAATVAARAPMNWPTGTAPTSPVDGDQWREDNTNTGWKIRVNGVTKTISLV